MNGASKNPIVAGQRFGAVTTVEDAGRSNDGHRVWLCKCDCGATCTKSTVNLRVARIHSCGCLTTSLMRNAQVKHGMRGSRTYSSWVSAKRRCQNPDDKDFPRYGARGITFCAEWSDSFEAFLTAMGERPMHTTLERIDCDGNYEPRNCKWATIKEQNRNRRVSVWVDWKGVNLHLSDVAADLGISYGAAFQRFKRGTLHANH